MRHCRYFAALIGALLVALLSGCATNHSPSETGGQPPAPPPQVDKKIVDAHAHYLQGLIYDLNEQQDLAEEEFSKAAIADPANTDLVLELSEGYLQQKQPEKALELLRHATAVPDAGGATYAELALVYSRLGKDDQALEAAQTAIKRDPTLIDGYRTLYFIYLGKGHPKDALKVLDRAVKVPDTAPDFNIELVELYASLAHQAPSEKANITTNAVLALHHASGREIDDPHLRLRLADDYNMFGDVTNATQLYLQLADEFNDTPNIHASIHDKLGHIYWSQTNYDKAAEQFQAVVQDDPLNAKAYYILGSLAELAHKLPEAQDYYQKTVLLTEDFEAAYKDLARVQLNLDHAGEALATLEKARSKFAPDFESEVLAGLAYEKQKDFTNAIAHLTAAEVVGRATEPARLDGDFYFDQGAAYERAGEVEQAERCFEKSLSLAPDSAEALNYLGYMLADRGLKLDKARDLIEKAVKLEPKNPAYLDSLGWVLYKLNQPREALVQEQMAIDLTPEPDPTLFDHIGDIYAALKQTDKARDAWQKSLKLEQNDQVRKKLDAATAKSGP